MSAIRRLFARYAEAQHSRLVLDLTESYAVESDLLLAHF